MNKFITIAAVLIMFNQSFVLGSVDTDEIQNVGEYNTCISACETLYDHDCTFDEECRLQIYYQNYNAPLTTDCVDFSAWLTEADGTEFSKGNLTIQQSCWDTIVTFKTNDVLNNWNQCNQACLDETVALVCTRASTTVGEYDTCAAKCDWLNTYDCNVNYLCYNAHKKQAKCESTTIECENFKTFTEKDWATSLDNVTIADQKTCLSSCVDSSSTADPLPDWDTCLQTCIDNSCSCCDESQEENPAVEEESYEEEYDQTIDTMGKYRDCIKTCSGDSLVSCSNDKECFAQSAKQLSCEQLIPGCTAFIAYDGGASDSSSITNDAKANKVSCYETCAPERAPALTSIKYLSDWNTCNLECIYKVDSTSKQDNNTKDDEEEGDNEGGSASILTLGVVSVLSLFTTL